MSDQSMVLRDARTDVAAFEPGTFDELKRVGEMVIASGLAPEGVKTAAAACLIIATGRELGISAMKALRTIYVVKGRPTLSADLMAALCKQTPAVCRYFRIVEMTPTHVTCETHRVGEPEPTAYTYTLDDARTAGLLTSQTWKAHPTAMLKARCVSALARAVYPDLIMGLYDPDELATQDDGRGRGEYVDAEVVRDEPSKTQRPRDERRVQSEKARIEYERLAAARTRFELRELWATAAKAEGYPFERIDASAPWKAGMPLLLRVLAALRPAAGIVEDAEPATDATPAGEVA
jgi:hypothetical protein